MVLAKDKVECILKCKLDKQCTELHCRKFGNGKLIKKTKKMNNEYHGKI